MIVSEGERRRWAIIHRLSDEDQIISFGNIMRRIIVRCKWTTPGVLPRYSLRVYYSEWDIYHILKKSRWR